MTTKQNDAAALTDEQVEGVAGGWMGPEGLRLVPTPKEGIIDPYFIIDPYYLPRPPVGPCGPKFRRR